MSKGRFRDAVKFNGLNSWHALRYRSEDKFLLLKRPTNFQANECHLRA